MNDGGTVSSMAPPPAARDRHTARWLDGDGFFGWTCQIYWIYWIYLLAHRR
jgi:hypothetical protein